MVPADLGPKAAPAAGYVRADPAAAPRAKPRAEPSAAFRQTEAELIRLLGAAPLEDPIEDFKSFGAGSFSHLMCPIGLKVRSLACADAPPR